MSPLTIKLLVAGGLVGVYYLMNSPTASAAPNVGPAPGPFPQPGPAPNPNQDQPSVPSGPIVDAVAGFGPYGYRNVPPHNLRAAMQHRTRRGWPWY